MAGKRTGKPARRAFGGLEARRSKTTGKIVSWRARYTGPDQDVHLKAFGDQVSAEAWLFDERKLIDSGEWIPPAMRDVAVERMTLSEWGREYVESRTLAPSTYRNYTRMLRVYVDPSIGRKFLDQITVPDVAAWHARLKSDLRARSRAAGRTNGDGSGEASQVYKFVSGVLRGAVARGLIDSSPARVQGGGRHKRQRQPVVLAAPEVRALALALPEKYRALADLLSSTGLRIGEARALRRRDIDVRNATVTVLQNVSQGAKGVGAVVGKVKTDAGNRTVAITPTLAQALSDHLEKFAQPGRDGLVFPGPSGGVLPDSTWRYAWIRAREAAGLPDIKTHDLRHTSLTMAARAGATTAELMHRAGHSEARVAMLYQHASAERDRMIAERMEAMARADELAARREQKRAARRPTSARGGPEIPSRSAAGPARTPGL